MPSQDAITGWHPRMPAQAQVRQTVLSCSVFCSVFLQVLRRHPRTQIKVRKASQTNAHIPGRRNPYYPSATSPHIAAPLLSQSVSVSIWRASQIRSRRERHIPSSADDADKARCRLLRGECSRKMSGSGQPTAESWSSRAIGAISSSSGHFASPRIVGAFLNRL